MDYSVIFSLPDAGEDSKSALSRLLEDFGTYPLIFLIVGIIAGIMVFKIYLNDSIQESEVENTLLEVFIVVALVCFSAAFAGFFNNFSKSKGDGTEEVVEIYNEAAEQQSEYDVCLIPWSNQDSKYPHVWVDIASILKEDVSSKDDCVTFREIGMDTLRRSFDVTGYIYDNDLKVKSFLLSYLSDRSYLEDKEMFAAKGFDEENFGLYTAKSSLKKIDDDQVKIDVSISPFSF